MARTTPLMEQYFDLRKQYSDCLLLFQVGDFYELFFEQAQEVARVLNITLTSRGTNNGEPIPLCGVPLHALDHYLGKLVKAGFHVAICNQLEEARPGVIVKRGVTQVITPATITDGTLLDAKHSSYLCSCVITHEVVALAFAEVLTGVIYATTIASDDRRSIEAQLARFMPAEVLIESVSAHESWRAWVRQLGYSLSEPVVSYDGQFESWFDHFAEQQRLYVKRSPVLLRALELLYGYVGKQRSAALEQLKTLTIYKIDDWLVLDAATQRNLELVRNNRDGSSVHTLFWVLDKAATSMGARMIKRWLLAPLCNSTRINHRLDAVQTLISAQATTQELIEQLHEVGDIERVVGRIALAAASLGDYIQLAHALAMVPRIKQLLTSCAQGVLLTRAHESMIDFSALQQLLAAALNTDSAHDVLIKTGFDHELDTLRQTLAQVHERVVALELAEQESTGISSLKIRFNSVQGYYIEITKANMHLAPERYRRQQTLVGKERFVTPELLELEHQVTYARAQVQVVELRVYEKIKTEVAQQLSQLRVLAHTLATTDALIGLSVVAYDNGYCRPVLHETREIRVVDGKHPVIAQLLGRDFIANNAVLTEHERLLVITGPNMGGKSTYLRQVALISLMAQCGSFVPAQAAYLPIIDRIFTRVGAGDSLAEGKSTFLVEMEETAVICTQATARSLVILDEVGRGTSTYDGLAIAQAVLEFLYHQVRPLCLFATHYHELTQLETQLPGVINYHAASKSRDRGVLFLHKIIRGPAQGSFGIEVAQLAQVPEPVITRAREILQQLAAGNHAGQTAGFAIVPAQADQLDQKQSELVRILEQLDLDNLSPRQAHDLLGQLKERLRSP